MIYQDIEDLIAASSEGNPAIPRFDCSVFDGDYITGDVDETYLDKLEATRANNTQPGRMSDLSESASAMVGMQNDD